METIMVKLFQRYIIITVVVDLYMIVKMIRFYLFIQVIRSLPTIYRLFLKYQEIYQLIQKWQQSPQNTNPGSRPTW